MISVAGSIPKLLRAPNGLLALWLLLAVPVLAQAAGISFQNDLKTPIIVQGESIVGGMIRKGQPVLILPRGTGLDLRPPLGNRRITIFDANLPGRILHRQTVPFLGQDLRFMVRPGLGGTLQLVPLP
jgi:hypothetical protein